MMRWLRERWLRFSSAFSTAKPVNLRLRGVRRYARVVPQTEAEHWAQLGWTAVPGYSDFSNRPRPDQVVMFSTPVTLMDIDPQRLIGSRITGHRYSLGTYGMGGCGFFGLTLDHSLAELANPIVLVYTVMSASDHTLFDDRPIGCAPQWYEQYRPWIAPRYGNADYPVWDELKEVITDSRITSVSLLDDALIMQLDQAGCQHTIRFVKHDPELPPFWNGVPQTPAYKIGVIREYFVFQEPNDILYC